MPVKLIRMLALFIAISSLLGCGAGVAAPTDGSTSGSQTTAPAQTTVSTPSDHVHTYTDRVVPSNLAWEGYTEHTCQCGHSFRDTPTPLATEITGDILWKTREVLHWFDDAAFIGDSISLQLKNFNAKYGTFGKAVFLVAGSYGLHNAVNDVLRVSYRGKQLSSEDALAECGAKKVFILLGMNDFGYYGVDDTMANWEIYLGRLKAKNHDVEIFIQSGTPIFKEGEKKLLNNANMEIYNQRLKAFAEANGCHFVDIATIMRDVDGSLKEKYSSDRYVHLSELGCNAWAHVLRDYVEGLPQ